MNTLDLGSMFLLGFLGSGHCVGMCGPIVVALPRGRSPTLGQLVYHLARIITYTGIGASLAALGAGLGKLGEAAGADPLESVKRVQLAISLVAALALGVFGLSRLGVLREPRLLQTPSLTRVPVVGRWLARLFQRGDLASTFALGLLLGFLPCGLSFAAFARALPAGDPGTGALLVAAFGLGTFPALLAVGTVGAGLLRKHRQLSELLSGVVMLAMAVSLAADGLLGVL